MLSEAAAISDSITSGSVYCSLGHSESESSARIISDLKACFEKALERRRVVRIPVNDGIVGCCATIIG